MYIRPWREVMQYQRQAAGGVPFELARGLLLKAAKRRGS
jgi:hypothetical protein